MILLVLTFVLLCCISVSLCDLSPGQIHTNPHVLLISSYSPDFPTVFNQIDGVKSVLSPEKVDLDIEFMDVKRFPSLEDINEFSQRLTKKIRRLPTYDLILVADDSALNLVLEKQQELFNNTPIVFFGINEQCRVGLPEKTPFITGVMEEVSVKETIDLMIQLQPDARTIIALSDDTISGKADAEKFLGYISSYPGYNLTVLSLANLTWNEYALKLQAINQSSSVLLLSAFKDKNQVTSDFDESLQFIKQNLHVPLFHLWYYGMGDGIVGGVLISQYDQGRNAALMADRILQGTPPSEIPVRKDSSNPVVFDYHELVKYGLNPSVLPPGSTVINKPASIIVEPGTIILALFLIICLVLVIAVHIVLIKKRHKAEQKVSESRAKLEMIIEAKTHGLEQASKELSATQKKLLEYIQFLTTREKELQKSEEKFRNLVQDIHNILVTFTPDGVITYINPYAERFFGYTTDELVGLNLIGTIIPEDTWNDKDTNQFIHDLELGSEKSKQRENANRKKNGDIVWILWTNRGIRDDTGTVTSVISVGIDITERRKLEGAIQEANIKLNLLSSITRHDLLNLMTSIIMYIHIINENPDDKENSRYLNMMSSVLKKMRTQIEFTRDYQDVGVTKPGWHDVGVLFRRSASQFRERTVQFSNEVSNIEIYADNMLEKVIFNLIENSLRHGMKVTQISFNIEIAEKGIVLVYSDNGIGIADDEKELIFTRGFGKNTGFGMFLVHEILQITGISIVETGKADSGVRFEIHVPNGVWRRISDL